MIDAKPLTADDLSEADKVKLILANKDKIKAQAKKNRKEMGMEDESDMEEEEVEREPTIFDYDVDCVDKRKAQLLEKYPWAANQIEDAIMKPERLPRIKKKLAEKLLKADEFLQAFSKRGPNMSFEEQKTLRKVLVEAAEDGEETDYESDSEAIMERDQKAYDTLQDRQSEKVVEANRGIFQYLSVMDTKVMLPPMKQIYKKSENGPLTLFLELDDVLVHTFICDENTGYIAKPTFKDPEYEFMLKEVRLPILVYERDHMDDFLKYL